MNWEEGNFVRDGVDVINPFDLAALNQLAVPVRDLRIPQGMFWGTANITEVIAVEGHYQYEWEPVGLPPIGSFFSTNDLLDNDNVNFAMLGAELFSDQGTDLDTALGLPPGTLGFGRDFFRIPGIRTEDASDSGQFGLSVSLIPRGTNAMTLAAYVVRYNSRLPVVSGKTANQRAIDATSQAVVDARAASLVPAYESTGLTPEESATAASQTATALTTSDYANQAGYIVEYPDDITMAGLSFNTATIKRGLLLAGEFAHHMDFPFQVSLSEVFASILSPMEFDNAGNGGALGSFGANDRIKGYIRRDRSQGTRVRPGATIVRCVECYVHLISRMTIPHSIPIICEQSMNSTCTTVHLNALNGNCWACRNSTFPTMPIASTVKDRATAISCRPNISTRTLPATSCIASGWWRGR